MVIKEEARLKKGDIISTKLHDYETGEEKEENVIADIVSSNHVTFRTSKGLPVNISNIDLVRMGVYKRKDIVGNILPRSKEEIDDLLTNKFLM